MSNSQRSAATYLSLATVLVIYPGFRMAVGYLDLFPAQDGRTAWWSLWAVILVGHLICAAVVLAAIASETGGLASVGIDIAVFVRRRYIFLLILLVACLIGYLAPSYLYGGDLPEQMRSHPLGPVTAAQRVFWVVMAVTAGFVEELAYRGYAITRLRGLLGLPIAVIASIVAFALMHGPSAFIPQFSMLYLVSGALFATAFLWMRLRRLEVLIITHTAIDLLLVAAP